MAHQEIKERTVKTGILKGAAAAGAVGVALVAGANVQAEEHDGEKADLKVGTYDAQSVFQQYPERQKMMQDMQKLQSDMQKAQKNKEQKKMQNLQQKMRKKQQSYIDKFEGAIDDAVPELAEEKGIDLVVQEVTYTADDVEKVDLTSDIIKALGGDPDAGPQMPMMPGKKQEKEEKQGEKEEKKQEKESSE